MIMQIKKEFRFEASHQLPNHDGKCARLHGHSWVFKIWVTGEVNEEVAHPKEGMVIDFADVKAVVQPIIDMLDHYHLGYFPDVPDHLYERKFPLVPTSENILIWIADQLPPNYPWEVLFLSETCTSEARLLRQNWAVQCYIDQQKEELENAGSDQTPNS